MTGQPRIKWLAKPGAHDYPAALSYLALIFGEGIARSHVARLRRARISEFKAKDIFRASALSLLGVSNAHVEKDRRRIQAGKALSALLLVRYPARGALLIADGYHRLCAVYSFDEDAVIPCKIA